MRIRSIASVLLAAAVIACFPAFAVIAGAEYSAEPTAEVVSVDTTGKSEGYSSVLYDNTNGLPTSEANAVAETSDGFIWIGSYSGLIRYDGNHFERMDSTTGISSVVSLFVDSRDRLWVGTNDSGLYVIDKGVTKHFGKTEGLQSMSVRSVTESSDGTIYAATTYGLAVIDDTMELTLADDSRIKEKYIRRVCTGCDGIIYGLTIDGEIFTISGTDVTKFYDTRTLGVNSIHCITPDPVKPGILYAGTKDSYMYCGNLKEGFESFERINISPLKYINAIERFGDMTWICADNGIGFISDDDHELVSLDKVPMNTSVENMAIDYQGNPWFVSSQQGIMKIVKNQFTDVFEQYDIENEVVYSTCAVDGKLFIGTKNSGLRVLENGRQLENFPIKKAVTASGEELQETDLISMFSGCRIRSIIHDSKERVWFATFGSMPLVMYDHGDVTVFTETNGLTSDRIRAVYEMKNGDIAAFGTGGVAVISNGKVKRVLDGDDGIKSTEILTVAEDTDNNMVIGTDGGGMYVITVDGVEHYGVEDGLSSDVVMRVKPDIERDICWVVTSNSLAYMDAHHKITTIADFPYSNNFDLYENSRGDIWVLSSNGIYVTSADELIANGDISPVYYGMDNGLPCITTSNSYSELTPDGDLYISGTTGVAKVNIEKPFEDIDAIKMSIPFISADDDTIYPGDDGNFRIPAQASKIKVDAFVYNYSLINPMVTYCLEGVDKKPVTVRRSELAPVDYTNLKGGSYDFVMSVADQYGNRSSELKIHIIKKRTVYEKLWFKAVIVLLIAAVIAAIAAVIVRQRTKMFLKKEMEDKLLIREIVEAFAKVIDMKDKYTNGHSTRVAEYTAMLTKELGYDEETVERYYNIALLHDIGKVGVPPEVLNKPGKLTDTEFNIIKSHSALGFNTLKNISIMPELAIGAGAHHERPDGKGYPKGLKGDEIPRVAQIIAIADTFDAMYSDRPYRKRMNFDKAVSIISEVRDTQLTGDVVDAFMRLVDKGCFRHPDDNGGGTTEDIDNIRKKFKDK